MKSILKTGFSFLFVLAFTKGFSQGTDDRTLFALVQQHASRMGLSAEQAQNCTISSSFSDEKTGNTYVYLQQRIHHTRVFNHIKTVIFRGDLLLYHSGQFYGEPVGEVVPQVSATAAVIAAAGHLGLSAPEGLRVAEDRMQVEQKIILSEAGIARQPITAELFWVVTSTGTARLAWNINIDVLGSDDWWNVRVDVLTREVLEQDNWTVHEAAPHPGDHHTGIAESKNMQGAGDATTSAPPPAVTSAGYFVIPFPFESPNHQSFAAETNPWLKAGASNPAVTNGWHFDGANNYSITRGNNVFAYLDVLNTNTPGSASNWPDTSSTAIPVLAFNTAPNFQQQPSVITNKKTAVTNLFYWNNIIHDLSYQYGFNEASGNFQADNMGRGGAGNDYVQAEAQDASGTNNANFSTPADGSRPRMQMYLFGGTATVKVNSPPVIAGNYNAPESNFSTANSLASVGPVTGQVVYYNDNAAGTLHEACTPPVNALSGKIALIDRGNCNFTDKVKNAQDAGAIGVIMVNNVAGSPITMGGADNTITIPAVMISQSDGAAIKVQLGNNVNVTLSAGVGRDGDFDNGIIVHEYGHGISNRLTGGRTNASCLNNAEQAGEGWSDYLAMMFTTNWANAQVSDGAIPRPMGTFAFGQPVNGGGIRAYPYSTNMSINPLTYGNIASNTQVHFVGTVWCTVLWDMTWNIIQQTGSIDPDIYNSASTSGNAIALRLVMEGMRLQPCRPGFLDSRDAILAADSILYNGAFRCAIWNAFARRGMGYSAVQGLSTVATDQVPAFDIPSTVRLTKSATPVIVSPGGQHTFTIAATCDCQASANGYIIRDTIPAGFSYVSSTGGSVSGNVLTFPALSFTAPQQTLTYQVTLKAESGGCIIDTAINDNREVNLAGGFVSAAATGTTQWVTSNARSKSPSTSWFAANNGTATDFTLTSAPFFLAGNLSVLSLWHYYVTENEIDGGRIELSTNGTTWTEISTLMVQNGYRKTTSGSSAWGAGQRVFTGVSYGQGSNQFINTVADLSVFNGQTVRLRLRMRSNGTNSGTYEGWFVDDISLMYGCGGLLKTGLFNNAGVKIDSAVVPVFVKSSLLPLTILSQPMAATACTGDNAQFSISVTGGSGAPAYQWQVSTNGGVSYSNIAGATQNTFTVPAVTSAMNGNRYRCVITGSSAISYSAGAELIVIAAPVPGTLTNATVCEGASVPFNAGASGSNLTYQWQTSSNGGASYTDVNGATAATFTLPALAAQNGVRVRVVVSNSCGASTSNAAIITVNPKPVITFQNVPADIVCSSDPAFQVTASPAGGTWGGAGTNGLVTPSFLLPGLTAVTYSVTSAAGCSATSSASFEVSSCAAQMLLVDAPGAIIIYPNPSNGRFSIKINTRLYQRLLVRVYATDGKLVRTQDLSGLSYGTVVPLNFMTLAGGMYMMSISDPVSGRELHEQLLIHRW